MSSRSSNNDGGDGNFTETEFLFVVARLLPLPQSVLDPPWFNLFSTDVPAHSDTLGTRPR